MGKDGNSNRGGIQPLIAVLVTIYLVFAVALAHTAYVAIQGRHTAAEGLQASHTSISAFTELKDQIAELRRQLAEAQAAQTNSTSSQIQQHLQQLKTELSEQLAQPLQQHKQAAQELLAQTSNIDKRFNQLQTHVTTMTEKIHAPAPTVVGARVDDKELHHIVTANSVCDKQGASGLALNVTEDLIAPLVIVGHNRPGYLAKTMMVLMK